MGFQVELLFLQVARGERVGDKHLLRAQNPVYLVQGRKGEISERKTLWSGSGSGDGALTLKALRVLGEADTVVTPRGRKRKFNTKLWSPIRGTPLFSYPYGKGRRAGKIVS